MVFFGCERGGEQEESRGEEGGEHGEELHVEDGKCVRVAGMGAGRFLRLAGLETWKMWNTHVLDDIRSLFLWMSRSWGSVDVMFSR